MDPNSKASKVYWFLGASFENGGDQTARFLEEGIWESGDCATHADRLKSIAPGDRVAIKSSYTREQGLPFDNRGLPVPVMAIKAIGTVKETLADGQTLRIDWEPLFPETREWYFYTHRQAVWRVVRKDWDSNALIDFAFYGQPQDIDAFRNEPYWHERFGDEVEGSRRFKWTKFYEEIADKLLTYRDRRVELAAGIHAIATRVGGIPHLQDRFVDGSRGPLEDICPFTVIGIFNRGVSMSKRKLIAEELADFLDMSEPAPDSFEGIPILNNMMSLFFGHENRRQEDDIDVLWEVFSQALRFVDSDVNEESRAEFVAAYNEAMSRYGVRWNLTMGLYWIRPKRFPTLDDQSRTYISNVLNLQIGKAGPKGACDGTEYLELQKALEDRFQEKTCSVHSFPELSLEAWQGGSSNSEQELIPADDEGLDASESHCQTTGLNSYNVEDILQDGSFLDKRQLEEILERLRIKKNLILQGPPGTGKTWLAKRLAYALIGRRDSERVRAVQFHPNVSYEDFVRGWRPDGAGKLSLVDGPFVEMIEAAKDNPDSFHVLVIEEINRGNPAQIFGEMLTLLEADKRNPDDALELTYRKDPSERVFIPANLHVIGTMNVADRSLALVDLALRRRFAFIDLEPTFGQSWHDWVESQCGLDSKTLHDIENKLTELNHKIAEDINLGPQFRVGHSYATPPADTRIDDGRAWFRQVVETEIGPLLDEYWFDAPEQATAAKADLLEGF